VIFAFEILMLLAIKLLIAALEGRLDFVVWALLTFLSVIFLACLTYCNSLPEASCSLMSMKLSL